MSTDLQPPYGDLPRITGVKVFDQLPETEKPGLSFDHEGRTLWIGKSELERLRKLPTAEEIRNTVGIIKEIMRGASGNHPSL